jgi:hypothetical protein
MRRKVAVPPDALDRILDLDSVSGLLRLQPEVTWQRVEDYLGTTAWEAPLVAWDRESTALALASARAAASPFLPLAEPADWVRDLRLRTPEGTEVASPFAPRRATGPELRFPALALGERYARPTLMSLLCLPRAPRVELAVHLGSAAQGAALLRRVALELGHLSLAAQVVAQPSGATLRVTLRRTGEAALPAWLADLPGEAGMSALPREQALVLRHAWGRDSQEWAGRLDRALAGGGVLGAHVSPVGPHGLQATLYGVGTADQALESGLLDQAAAGRIAAAVALREALLDACDERGRTGGRP